MFNKRLRCKRMWRASCVSVSVCECDVKSKWVHSCWEDCRRLGKEGRLLSCPKARTYDNDDKGTVLVDT